MIVYVSPNEKNGGVLQFSAVMSKETLKIKDCKLFVPDTLDENVYSDIKDIIIKYKKTKTFNQHDKRVLDAARQIAELSPEMVVFTEDSLPMQQLSRILCKKGFKTAVVVHDIKHHPYRNMGARRILVDLLRRKMMVKTAKYAERIILLSNNSDDAFRKEYKAKNTVVFRLPAHVPEVESVKPPELKNTGKNFFLFFGRIDKYKGIDRLCDAYVSLPEEFKKENRLIIAGKGNFSDRERKLMESECYIHSIERFIQDGEMIWLFQNCNAVVMPYIEASQSGVLPIAYKYGKPVIASDLPGIAENMKKGETGIVFKTVDELSKILYDFEGAEHFENAVNKYYNENYLWQDNIKKLLKNLNLE